MGVPTQSHRLDESSGKQRALPRTKRSSKTQLIGWNGTGRLTRLTKGSHEIKLASLHRHSACCCGCHFPLAAAAAELNDSVKTCAVRLRPILATQPAVLSLKFANKISACQTGP